MRRRIHCLIIASSGLLASGILVATWLWRANVGGGARNPVLVEVGGDARFFELADTAMLVCVDGVGLTKGTVKGEARLRASIYARNNNLSEEDARVISFREECERQAIAGFVVRQLLVNEAARQGIAADTNRIAQVRRDLARALRISDDNDFYGCVAQRVGISAETVHAFVMQGALAMTVQNMVAVPPSDISASIVSNRLHALKVDADMCAVSNGVQRAKILSALVAVTNGVDFATVARRVSELHPEQGVQWDVFSAEDLALQIEGDPADVIEWAFSAPVGSVSSAPVEMDDGVGLLKILARTDGMRNAVAGATRTAEVTLARLVVRAFDGPDIPTFDELRTQLAEAATRDARIRHNQQLFLHAQIAYPNGTNLWPEVEMKTETK